MTVCPHFSEADEHKEEFAQLLASFEMAARNDQTMKSLNFFRVL